MNKEIAGAFFGYFRILYRINQNLLILCGDNILFGKWESETTILDMTQDITKIIPIKCKDEELTLVQQDGLLDFKNDIPFLLSGYEEIFSKNYCFLKTIKRIRNKCEHEMHKVFSSGSVSGPSNTTYVFNVPYNGKTDAVAISIEEFVDLIKDFNILFSKLQTEVITYAKNNQLTNHPYYKRLRRFSFDDFNKIYESEVLQAVGRVMIDF